MIDRGRVLDQQWAERYVAGQLTPEEIREFEETMLEHPEVLEEVERARTVKLGLKTLRERGVLERLVGARPKRPQRWFAAAAAGVVACALGLFLLKGNEVRPILARSLAELTSGQQQVSTANDFLVAKTRGAEAILIEASSADPVIALRALVPASRAGMIHHVELFQGTERLARIDAVPGGDYLAIYLDTSRLETGSYGLRLTTDDERIPATTYPLHLTRK
jgi:hypothetical protein